MSLSKHLFYIINVFVLICPVSLISIFSGSSINSGSILGGYDSSFTVSAFAGEKVLSLDDCLKLGLENNPKLKSAKLMIDSAQEDINAAKADFLPSVSAGANYSNITSIDASGPTDADYIDQQNTNYNIGVSQVLYAGNRLINSRDRAVERKKMYIEEKAYTQAEIAYQIKQVYFQLMKAKQDVAIGLDTVKRLEADVKSAKAFYEKEMTPYAKVLQAEVALADIKQQFSKVKNTVDRKKSELFVLMNKPFDSSVTFSGGLDYYSQGFTMTSSQCLSKAIDTRPDLKSLDHQMVMVEKDIEIAKGKYHPLMRLNTGYYDQDKDYDSLSALGTSMDQRNTYWSAGVNLSWTLFDGGRGWYEKRRSQIDMKRINEQIKEIKSKLEAGIVTALMSLSEAEERIKATFESITASKEYYDMENKRFQAGIATVSEVLDAQVSVTRAEVSYNQALLDYQLARAELDFMTGSSIGK